MLSSPFQQPSRRQNALALQIQDAKAAGDEALRSRLISQWVHRYGFNSASELDLDLPEPTISEPEFSPAAEAEESSFTPESVAEQEEAVAIEEVVAEEEEVVVEEELDDQDEVFAEDEMVVEDEVLVEEKVELQRSLTPGPVPAPPISTPRSLRRWLPRREDDVFPKAS